MASSIRAFELRKYYNPRTSPHSEDAESAKPPSDLSTPTPPAHNAIAAFTQVVSVRLKASGAFVALTDGTVWNFIPGSTDNSHGAFDRGDTVSATAWFVDSAAVKGWLSLPRRVLERSPGPDMQRCVCIPDLTRDEDTKALPSVTGPPFLRFYAAAPIALSEQETIFLQGMAKRCMEQLEMTREVEAQRRGLMMSDGIDSFIQHREGVNTNTPEKTASNIAKGESPKITPGETPQPKMTNIPQDSGQAHEGSKGNSEQVCVIAQQANKAHDSDAIHGETTYRKTFRRAAACLRAALEVDGVMFVNGFIGWHGGMMPVGEPEVELERENTQMAKLKRMEATTDSEISSEETHIVQVLESGRSYTASSSDMAPTVTLNIGYHDSWVFMTEPGALRRIMMNVIGNAMKYSPGGAVVVSLHACAVEALESQDNAQPGWSGERGKERKVVVFAVKDTGKGMSKDFLENQLFLPFHQEDAVKSEGVGLGMSIVKSLAGLLAGRIEVTSQLGKGSDVKISIAMAAGRTTQHTPGASAIEQSLAILRSRGLTVAVHGVEHATAQSLRAYVHDWFECAVVALGDEGPQPDIILADGTDNDKFAELRTQLRAYDQRLAVLTVSAGPPNRASSMYVAEKHIWERISRPLGPHKLAKALMRCLERPQHSDQSQMEGNGEGQQQEAGSITSSHLATSPSATAVSPSRAATPVVQGSPSILLVEDNKINLKLLETFVAKKGYTNVESAADGLQAVQAAERHAKGFDVIITDVMMPVMDGFEASRKIRELERTRHSSSNQHSTSRKPALLIALTGLATANDRDKALRSGVDVFVTKPVRLEELGALLARWERGEIEGGSDWDAVKGASGS
ncbi:hypothetical protein B0A55_07515 [Friedmanniomyces simplex]|uniref:histidine kinase n=1 Tax=Friedmanniomyces simplex TaxID=329884 RepID=A0A4U0XWC7_9PEZI|nr:hypothetical protein B0A55_07515 [Friedmanniomyces simplex]